VIEMILDEFLSLSEALTGVTPLDGKLAQQYLQRCTDNPLVGPILPNLIKTFQDIQAKGSGATGIKARIMNDSTLVLAAEQIIYLWYVSAFYLPDLPGTGNPKWQYSQDHPEQYDGALMWKVIGAHPPMTAPKEKFGYWGEPPEAAQ